MTTTSTFQGLEPETRNSSRVLRPPGGGSSFSFGLEGSKQQQPVRRHKMASNIFGIPDEEPAPTSCASEPGASESAACGDEPHRTCAQAEYSEAAEDTQWCSHQALPMLQARPVQQENHSLEQDQGEAEVPETEPAKEASGDAAPVAVPSRRNPPGGKSSLILG